MDGNEAAVADGAIEIVDEQFVGIDDDQGSIAPQLVEHRAAESAHAGAIFNEQLAAAPIDGPKHLPDREAGRRDDRTDHHRMLQKTLEKDAPWPEEFPQFLLPPRSPAL